MTPDDPPHSPPPVPHNSLTPTPPEVQNFPREIALDFPVGDGRTGRCHVRLFHAAIHHSPETESGFLAEDASDASLMVALIEAPPGGGGYHLSLYAGAIASALCGREHIAPDHLLYIDRDREAGARMSEWAILLGPQALYAYSTAVSEGSFSGDTFHLVAFDFEAGALVRPRFTPLSRLDVETFIGSPLES